MCSKALQATLCNVNMAALPAAIKYAYWKRQCLNQAISICATQLIGL